VNWFEDVGRRGVGFIYAWRPGVRKSKHGKYER
jgi:hypothetical protein